MVSQEHFRGESGGLSRIEKHFRRSHGNSRAFQKRFGGVSEGLRCLRNIREDYRGFRRVLGSLKRIQDQGVGRVPGEFRGISGSSGRSYTRFKDVLLSLRGFKESCRRS